jgi:UDP-N-acetylglucosamine 2-epimerase (non-hydrolysing)
MHSISVFLVGGARPNFMKVAALYKAMAASPEFYVRLVHTGQHYDDGLSDVFFRDLDLPPPDIRLEVGSGSHGVQTARVLERFEKAVVEGEPDLIIVVGDVNSTIACALAAVKIAYPSGRRPKVAHVEAGLRSSDRTMPEEINRVLTDAISHFLFTTEASAGVNLAREGVPADQVFFVGNVMIDTLLEQAQRAAALRTWEAFGLKDHGYAVLTLHRPSNVDDPRTLANLTETLYKVGRKIPVVFPAHPRTVHRLRDLQLGAAMSDNGGIRFTPPMGYIEFLSLMSHARFVLTDSGGIQEETTILGIPCLTLRENTERPVTVTHGSNILVGTNSQKILEAVAQILAGEVKLATAPELWDGNAAQRIVQVLARCF